MARLVTERYAANGKGEFHHCCAGALCTAAAEVMPAAHPVGLCREAGCAKGAASLRSQHSRLLKREEGCVKQYAILLVGAVLLCLSSPAASGTQDKEPPIPTGRDLLVLTRGQFQLYVSGIYEGHTLMASMVREKPVVCIDPMLTRTQVAAMCLAALPVIPDRMMTLPAAEVVMSILMKQHPCEAAETRAP